MQIHALLCVALASSAVAQVAQRCQANATYCGWYLASTGTGLGWRTFTTDPNGIWSCNNDLYSVSYVKHCAFGCTGPNAACATNPSETDPETTTTSTTTTSTETTGKPTWTGGWGKPY